MSLSEPASSEWIFKGVFFARSAASRGQGNEMEKIGFLTDEAMDRARS
jgi:hypothetical protein